MAIGREANVNSLHPSVFPSHETAGFAGGTDNPQSKICILAPKGIRDRSRYRWPRHCNSSRPADNPGLRGRTEEGDRFTCRRYQGAARRNRSGSQVPPRRRPRKPGTPTINRSLLLVGDIHLLLREFCKFVHRPMRARTKIDVAVEPQIA
jgi:hypothetical protein